jgi:hypothetical protein
MLKGMEAYQQYPSVLSPIVSIIRECVARDRSRLWTRFTNPMAPAFPAIAADKELQFSPLVQLAVPDILAVLALHSHNAQFVGHVFHVRSLPVLGLLAPPRSDVNVVRVPQCLGDLAFFEAEFVMQQGGIAQLTSIADQHIQDWNIVLAYLRAMRVFTFRKKPEILASLRAVGLMVKGTSERPSCMLLLAGTAHVMFIEHAACRLHRAPTPVERCAGARGIHCVHAQAVAWRRSDRCRSRRAAAGWTAAGPVHPAPAQVGGVPRAARRTRCRVAHLVPSHM